jgi:hypothetical protein
MSDRTDNTAETDSSTGDGFQKASRRGLQECLSCGRQDQRRAADPFVHLQDDRGVICVPCVRLIADTAGIGAREGGLEPRGAPAELRSIGHRLREMPDPAYPSAVYFLCDDAGVAYVGQSCELAIRIDRHRERKSFTHVLYVPVDHDKLDATEAGLILALRPRLNSGVRPKATRAAMQRALREIGFDGVLPPERKRFELRSTMPRTKRRGL